MTAQDHDTLVEVVQILKSHVGNFDRHIKHYEDHIENDEQSFRTINRNIYMFNGGLVVLNIVIGIILAFKFH